MRQTSFAIANIILSISLGTSVLACSDSEDTGPDGSNPTSDAGNQADRESDSASECLLQGDDACPEGCVAMMGEPWDEQDNCWLGEVVLDCVTEERSARPDAEGCYVNEESGTLFRTSTLIFLSGTAEYRTCDSEERELISATDVACE